MCEWQEPGVQLSRTLSSPANSLILVKRDGIHAHIAPNAVQTVNLVLPSTRRLVCSTMACVVTHPAPPYSLQSFSIFERCVKYHSRYSSGCIGLYSPEPYHKSFVPAEESTIEYSWTSSIRSTSKVFCELPYMQHCLSVLLYCLLSHTVGSTI